MIIRLKPLLIAASLSFLGSIAATAQSPSKHQEEMQPKTMSEAKQKATERAQVVPRQMGFDLSKYVCIPIDKNEPEGVLSDSEIRPFLAPIAIQEDWWIVLFIPENIHYGPAMCVYLDKKLNIVRGYLIGPSPKPASKGE